MLLPHAIVPPARFDVLAEHVVIRVLRTHCSEGGAADASAMAARLTSPWGDSGGSSGGVPPITPPEAQLAPVEPLSNASCAIEPGAPIGGKYTLLREAGMGGMGVVWVARNEATGGEVALKFLVPRAKWIPARLERLRREARAMARLSHRGIVRLFDLVETARGPLLLVMEMLHGHTLADELDAKGALPAADAVRIALDLLSALTHVHGSGIVHRDIKPENVFLARDPDGFVTTKLLDFGVSKMRFDDAELTVPGEVLGTPRHMSPEQAMGRAVDARSDIFAMGILLYEMLSGENPFAGADGHGLAASVLAESLAPLHGVPQDLWKVVARALRCDAEERFESAAAMATALREAMIHRLHILPRKRVRSVSALAAASLLLCAAFSLAGSPPATSASRAQPRVKVHRTVVTMPPGSSVMIATASPPPPQPPRAHPAHAARSILMDPGF